MKNIIINCIVKSSGATSRRNWTVMASAIMVIVLIALIAVAGCSGTPPTPTPTPVEERFELGEWAETPEKLVTMVSASRINSYNYWQQVNFRTETAPPATVFVIAEATVVNVGNDPLDISPDDFVLIDSAGHRYNNDVYKADKFEEMVLEPGLSASGRVLFVVPEVATGLQLSSILSGTPSIRAVWNLEF